MSPRCYVCRCEIPAGNQKYLAGEALCEACGPCCAQLGVAIGVALANAAALISLAARRGGAS